MKVNIGKGTEIFSFFGEYYKLISNFYVPDNNEHFFENLISASEDLLSKYKDCDFYIFARGLVLVFNVYVSDVKFKGTKSGKWSVTFKED